MRRSPRIYCILLLHYIKPQPFVRILIAKIIVSYCFTTSNHNNWTNPLLLSVLYLIASLHQTTTPVDIVFDFLCFAVFDTG